MSAWVIVVIILAVIAIALAVALAWLLMQRRRERKALQERFGPEYDRSVSRYGDRRTAERELAAAAQRRDSLDIRPLSEEARRHYAQRWQQVQAAFVDRPVEAVGDADGLIGEVMRERGYPVEDFDERAELIAADHPDVVEHYRAAHDLQLRTGEDGASTEQLRQSFVHYRALFGEMLEDRADGQGDGRPDGPSDRQPDAASEGSTAIRPDSGDTVRH